jgi:hypothetical protein
MCKILFLLFIQLPVVIWSQPATVIPALPPVTFKIAPGPLFNPVQTSLDFRADIPLARRWALEAGGGLIINSEAFAQFSDEYYRGVKIRPAIKFYLQRAEKKDVYLSLVVKHHVIRHAEYGSVTRQGNQYSEWLLLERRLNLWSGLVCVGFQNYLGSRQRFLLETYFGVGRRRLSVSAANLPADAMDFEDRDFNWLWQQNNPGVTFRPDVALSFCIGWAGRKPVLSQPSQ